MDTGKSGVKGLSERVFALLRECSEVKAWCDKHEKMIGGYGSEKAEVENEIKKLEKKKEILEIACDKLDLLRKNTESEINNRLSDERKEADEIRANAMRVKKDVDVIAKEIRERESQLKVREEQLAQDRKALDVKSAKLKELVA